jgi:choline monooxygenase
VFPTTIGGQGVVLVNDKGTIRAFQNVCRHRGAQLVSEPCSKRRTLLCVSMDDTVLLCSHALQGFQ